MLPCRSFVNPHVASFSGVNFVFGAVRENRPAPTCCDLATGRQDMVNLVLFPKTKAALPPHCARFLAQHAGAPFGLKQTVGRRLGDVALKIFAVALPCVGSLAEWC